MSVQMIANDKTDRLAVALQYYKGLAMFENYQIISPESRGMDNDTPIHMASYDGRLDLIMDMLPFVRNLDIAGDIGNTPLHYAVLNNQLAAVKLLLKYGANITKPNDYGDTPLAMMMSRPEFYDLVTQYSKSTL